ncbi:MAG: AI-2E family transporter [Kiloniellales bacterium]
MRIGPKRELLFWLISFAVFFLVLYLFRSILLPFVAGMATAYFLDPVCDRLEEWGLSRTLATALVTVVFLIIVVVALLLLVPLIVGQITDLLARLPDYIGALRGWLTSLVAIAEARLPPEVLERVRGLLAGSLDAAVGWLTSALGGLVSGGVAIANLLSLVIITPVVAFYLLRDWDRMVERVDHWLPRRQAETIREQAREVDRTLAGFVRGQASVCLILGAFYAIGLTVAGLEFGLVIGMIAGLLSFIPFVGAAIGGLLSVGLALVQFDSWIDVAVVAAIFAVGQAVEGNVLTPKLVGGRVGLHPVWVIFALLAGGALFGFVGVLLAVPVAAVIGVLMRFSLQRYLASDIYGGGPSGSSGPDAG